MHVMHDVARGVLAGFSCGDVDRFAVAIFDRRASLPRELFAADARLATQLERADFMVCVLARSVVAALIELSGDRRASLALARFSPRPGYGCVVTFDRNAIAVRGVRFVGAQALPSTREEADEVATLLMTAIHHARGD